MNARQLGLEPPAAVAAEVAWPACLIVNPRSFRASRGLAARAIAIAASHGAEVVRVDDAAQTTAAMEEILARRQRHVALLAGDGTVRAVVEQLSRLAPDAWTPDLLVLAGGRTNLTAADLTPTGAAMATLQTALHRARERGWSGALVERSALRIQAPDAPPRYGFFLCAAQIDSAIRQCHDYRAAGTGPLHRGPLSTPWWLAGLAGRAAFGRTGLICPELGVDAGRAGRLRGPMRVLLATTLEHPTGVFDPYARRGDGSLRLTAVARRAPRFWRNLPRLLAHRFAPAMDVEHGYLSGRCDRIEVAGLATYTLDGERFDADPERAIVISAGPRLRLFSTLHSAARAAP